MGEINKLWKIARAFYLIIFLCMLAFILWDIMYICKDNGICVTKQAVEMRMESAGAEKAESVLKPVNLINVVQDKVLGATSVGFFWEYAGIVLLLFLRYFVYADSRVREFRETWPIHCQNRVGFDFFSMLLLIIAGWMVQIGLIWAVSSRHNALINQVLKEKSDFGAISKIEMATDFKIFLLLMAIHLLYLTLFYTFLYLVANRCQNPILGIGGCLFGGAAFFMALEWGIDRMFCWEFEKLGMVYSVEEFSPLLQGLMWFSGMFYEGNLYECILDQEAYRRYMGFAYTTKVIGGLVIVEILLTLLIFMSAKRKDLAKNSFGISGRRAMNQWEVK